MKEPRALVNEVLSCQVQYREELDMKPSPSVSPASRFWSWAPVLVGSLGLLFAASAAQGRSGERLVVAVTTGDAGAAALDAQVAVLQALKAEPRLMVLTAQSWPSTVDAILSLSTDPAARETRAELFDPNGRRLFTRTVTVASLRSGRDALPDEVLAAIQGDGPQAIAAPAVAPAPAAEPGSVDETWTPRDFPLSTPGGKKEAPSAASCHGAAGASEPKTGVAVTMQYTSFAFPEGRGWYETTAPQLSYAPWKWLLLQARAPLHYLRVAGNGPVFGPGDVEVDAQAQVLGGKDEPFLVTAGVGGMLPSGSARRGLGTGHPGLGPIVSASLNRGDLAVFASVAGRFMFTRPYSHDAPAAGADAMPPDEPMPPEGPSTPDDPMPPGHQMAVPAKAGMSADEMVASGHPAPFVGRHERNEIGYSTGITYGRRHTIGAMLNGTTVVSPENGGQTLVTVRSEVTFRLTDSGGLALGTEIPLSEARRFQTTVWSSLAWKF